VRGAALQAKFCRPHDLAPISCYMRWLTTIRPSIKVRPDRCPDQGRSERTNRHQPAGIRLLYLPVEERLRRFVQRGVAGVVEDDERSSR
jgi:hypothetical protein